MTCLVVQDQAIKNSGKLGLKKWTIMILWTGSDEDDTEDNAKYETNLNNEMKKVIKQAKKILS